MEHKPLFFAEPPPTQYDLHFRIAGVPVRIHPMFWVVTLVLGLGPKGDPVRVLLWLIAAFACILVHELGHVAAFRYYGIDAHVVLHGFGGLAVPTGGRFVGRSGARESWISDLVISFAGPAAGFLFAAVIFAGLAASGRSPHVRFDPVMLLYMGWIPFEAKNINLLIFYAQFINIAWGIVNLLPVYPLDGGQMARAVFNQFSPADGLRQSLILSALTATGLAAFCYFRWESLYGALFFGFMAYNSFQAFQQSTGRGRW